MTSLNLLGIYKYISPILEPLFWIYGDVSISTHDQSAAPQIPLLEWVGGLVTRDQNHYLSSAKILLSKYFLKIKHKMALCPAMYPLMYDEDTHSRIKAQFVAIF